ncbi:hypothetical protein GCM10022415_33130 [Knoellia locipacati]|uniref:DUF2157 domain-containing protein n=1 Tax=Knoellia locipacati TaxID=882824 RepID=A0A512T528_9MICO|nr:hypothetical protein [Knoellia locipacati]GEQ15273.1 hypothetical protein KLO01_33200 [Knoellia locipacati]
MSTPTGTDPTTRTTRTTRTTTTATGRADEVVGALERAGLVDSARHAEAVAVVDPVLRHDLAAAGETPLRRRLGEVATYVGIAFVLAAVAVFLAPRWVQLTWTSRVAVITATGALLAVSGWAAARPVGGFAGVRDGDHGSRLRLVSVLLTSAAVAGAGAVGVAVLHRVQVAGTEATQGTRVGLAASATLVVLATVGYVLAPTLLGHAAIVVGVGYAVPFLVGELGGEDAAPIGIGYLVVGLVWLLLAERSVWREPVAGRLVGVAFLLVGAQLQLDSGAVWVGYVLTLVVGAAGFLLYLTRPSWPYLALGVAGVTLAVPEALLDWTEGTLGTAGALLGAGLALLLSGLLAMRIRRDTPT